MLVNLGSGHNTVIGITRSGKTYAIKKTLAGVKEGVIFFNTQHEEMPNTFINCTAADNIESIKRAIRSGAKINYIPDLDSKIREKELIFIINALYQRSNISKIYLVVDEVHLYEKDALKKLIQVSTTGLRFGIYGIWISQRPANVDNTLMTQSEQFIIFRTNMESGYFDRYGIPADQIKDLLEKGGKYAYCIYDFINITGPFKV